MSKFSTTTKRETIPQQTPIQEIYANPNHRLSIAFRDQNPLIDTIISAVDNNHKNQYPLASFNNKTGTIHIAFEYGEDIDNFWQKIISSCIDKQLAYHCQLHGYPTLANKPIIERIDMSDIEVSVIRFNVPPRGLDSFLKMNEQYSYRGPYSILKLLPGANLTINEHTVRLAPLYPVGDRTYAFMAKGCQITEMADIQMRRLLPQQEMIDENANFHWQTKEVKEHLGIVRDTYEQILNNLLHNAGIFPKSQTLWAQSEKTHLLSYPSAETPLRIVPLTEQSKSFYLRYGNIGEEELANCFSLEIDTLSYLSEVKQSFNHKKERLQEKKLKYKQDFAQLREDLIALSCTAQPKQSTIRDIRLQHRLLQREDKYIKDSEQKIPRHFNNLSKLIERYKASKQEQSSAPQETSLEYIPSASARDLHSPNWTGRIINQNQRSCQYYVTPSYMRQA